MTARIRPWARATGTGSLPVMIKVPAPTNVSAKVPNNSATAALVFTILAPVKMRLTQPDRRLLPYRLGPKRY